SPTKSNNRAERRSCASVSTACAVQPKPSRLPVRPLPTSPRRNNKRAAASSADSLDEPPGDSPRRAPNANPVHGIFFLDAVGRTFLSVLGRQTDRNVRPWPPDGQECPSLAARRTGMSVLHFFLPI